MESPFTNDIFAMIYQAFKNIFPNANVVEINWNPDIKNEKHSEKELYGCTTFLDNGEIVIELNPILPVCDCAEIFAHELAHAGVGLEHKHDEVWDNAVDMIQAEYDRIGEEMFQPDKKSVIETSINNKDYLNID